MSVFGSAPDNKQLVKLWPFVDPCGSHRFRKAILRSLGYFLFPPFCGAIKSKGANIKNLSNQIIKIFYKRDAPDSDLAGRAVKSVAAAWIHKWPELYQLLVVRSRAKYRHGRISRHVHESVWIFNHQIYNFRIRMDSRQITT